MQIQENSIDQNEIANLLQRKIQLDARANDANMQIHNLRGHYQSISARFNSLKAQAQEQFGTSDVDQLMAILQNLGAQIKHDINQYEQEVAASENKIKVALNSLAEI